MAYDNLQFCWHGVISTNPEKALVFYTEAIGWSAEKVAMGDDEATILSANGVARGHLSPPHEEGMPSHFTNYLRVEDVDAAVESAVKHGGTQIVPGTDIPPGRFAVVASPSGAALHLFHEADETTAENAPRDDIGSIFWVECHSTGAAADLAWLEKSFGMTGKAMESSDGSGPPGGYTILHDNRGQPLGGIMTSMTPDKPSFWLTWVAVDDVDACLGRIDKLGGKALNQPMDMKGIGRMAVVMDPSGAVFGVITPA